MIYKVLLTTSGTGSRLKELTENTNKCLININRKPAVEYILNRYPKSLPIVVTVGYLQEQVEKTLLYKYPDRKFEFVKISPYEGTGSSLGYSMLQARRFLDCPFIFHACDTLILEEIPSPNRNWAAGYVPPLGMDVAQYRTHKTEGKRLIRLNDKGISDFNALHIGLIGIFDHQVFWETLQRLYKRNPNDSTLSDVHVIDTMISEGFSFESIPFSMWLDTGNLSALKQAEQFLRSHNIPT